MLWQLIQASSSPCASLPFLPDTAIDQLVLVATPSSEVYERTNKAGRRCCRGDPASYSWSLLTLDLPLRRGIVLSSRHLAWHCRWRVGCLGVTGNWICCSIPRYDFVWSVEILSMPMGHESGRSFVRLASESPAQVMEFEGHSGLVLVRRYIPPCTSPWST